MTGVASRPAAEVYDKNHYLLGANNQIQLRDRKGNVSMDSVNADSFCVYEGQVLALCDDGYVYRYDTSGTFISTIDLYLYSAFQSNLTDNPFAVRWNFTKDGKLILDAFGYGNIIDCETWQNKTYIKNFVTYLPNRNEFVIYTTDSQSGIGICPRLSTEQLIEKAKQILGEFELTEEQKVFYGLLDE